MTKFILRWVINAIALYLAIFLLNGRGVEFNGNWVSIVWLALIFGLINAFLRPLLKILTCPLIILTLGLFTLLINTFLFWLTGQIGQAFNLGLSVVGFWPAFFGGLIVSVVSIVLSLILKDELKGKGA
ncbi:MAG TPA: phage holin family protein [Anaerolineales bacterium]|nr:phage holin family protein [Anaerolineales bacterium]